MEERFRHSLTHTVHCSKTRTYHRCHNFFFSPHFTGVTNVNTPASLGHASYHRLRPLPPTPREEENDFEETDSVMFKWKVSGLGGGGGGKSKAAKNGTADAKLNNASEAEKKGKNAGGKEGNSGNSK